MPASPENVSGLPPMRVAEPPDLGERAREERRPRVVAEAKAVHEAGGDRHDVLRGSRDLDAQHVGRAIEAQRRRGQELLKPRGDVRVRARDDGRRRKAARDLGRERRARERGEAVRPSRHERHDLGRPPARADLEALGRRDERHGREERREPLELRRRGLHGDRPEDGGNPRERLTRVGRDRHPRRNRKSPRERGMGARRSRAARRRPDGGREAPRRAPRSRRGWRARCPRRRFRRSRAGSRVPPSEAALGSLEEPPDVRAMRDDQENRDRRGGRDFRDRARGTGAASRAAEGRPP